MAQSIERPTLGFGSGHDLTVGGFDRTLLTVRRLLGILSLSLSLSAPTLLVLSPSFSK